jgi:hypothetical protein
MKPFNTFFLSRRLCDGQQQMALCQSQTHASRTEEKNQYQAAGVFRKKRAKSRENVLRLFFSSFLSLTHFLFSDAVLEGI